MKNLSFHLFGASMLVAVSPAAALQSNPKPPPLGTAISSNQKLDQEYNTKMRLNGQPKEIANMAAASAIARCVAKSAKAKAGALVGGPMTEDAEFKNLSRGLFGKYRNCAPTAEGIPLILINGALAEELVRLKQPNLQSRAVPADAASAKAFYATSGGVTMDSLGRCLAVYSPGLAYRVLYTGAGTAAESEAMATLYGQTPECGVRVAPVGIPVTEQRSAIATGLYSWLQKG